MNAKLLNSIEEYLKNHKDEFIADVKSLVSIKSVSVYDEPPYPYGRNTKAALDKALEIGASYGFDTENYEDYCGSISYNHLNPADKNAKFIGFWEHVDVVPEGIGWQFAKPYEPVEYKGCLIGRGVEDNKGAMVGVLMAMRALRELNVKLNHNLKLFVGCDEEHGMSDCEYYTRTHPNGNGVLSLIADSAFPVNYGEKGILELNLISNDKLSALIDFHGGLASNIIPPSATAKTKRIGDVRSLPDGVDIEIIDNEITFQARGKATHSSTPENGVNAIGRLTQALIDSSILPNSDASILELPNNINKTHDGAALSITMSDDLSGALTCAGTMASLRDSRFVLHLNIRYPVTANGESILGKIEEAARAYNYTVELIQDNKPNYYPKEKPIVGALTDLYNEIMCADTKPFVMAGGTYARKLPNAIGFGMGIPGARIASWMPEGHGGPHEPDEMIDVDLALKASAIFAMGIVVADSLV